MMNINLNILNEQNQVNSSNTSDMYKQTTGGICIMKIMTVSAIEFFGYITI